MTRLAGELIKHVFFCPGARDKGDTTRQRVNNARKTPAKARAKTNRTKKKKNVARLERQTNMLSSYCYQC